MIETGTPIMDPEGKDIKQSESSGTEVMFDITTADPDALRKTGLWVLALVAERRQADIADAADGKPVIVTHDSMI